MQLRADIPTMYPEERVFQLDDGTLAVVIIRQAESTVPGRLVLSCDCWEIDASGVPTGISAPRGYHSQALSSIAPGVGLGSIAEIVDALTTGITASLLEQKVLAAQLTQVPVVWLPAPVAPAIDIAHPLAEPVS